jgi:anthranilate phosphoribosyltransferase
MLKGVLQDLLRGRDLALEEAAGLFVSLLEEETTEVMIAALLVAWAAKGETAEELAGVARAMRERARRISTGQRTFIDTCGTGGSSTKTFNISTAAAFVVAAAGIPVAKHGNVGVTSRAGSADVLRELGARTELPLEQVEEIFDRLGICFLFAPLHHPATKRVGAVRRQLGIRTLFNLLGPLTNPAGAPYQLIGVSDAAAQDRLAGALFRLGIERAWVVRGEDGLDEITLTGETRVGEVTRHGIEWISIRPELLGLRSRSITHLRGGSAEENARLIEAVLAGERQDEALDLVLLNAAAAVAIVEAGADGVAATTRALPEAYARVRSALEEGRAYQRLRDFQTATQSRPATPVAGRDLRCGLEGEG